MKTFKLDKVFLPKAIALNDPVPKPKNKRRKKTKVAVLATVSTTHTILITIHILFCHQTRTGRHLGLTTIAGQQLGLTILRGL